MSNVTGGERPRGIIEAQTAEEARARLASLVRSADDAIVAKTLDGTVLDWNKAAERAYGYTAEEMVGRSITAIVPEDHRAEWEEVRAKVLRGAPVVGFETVRVRKDGRRLPISLTLSPIRDPRGEVVGISGIERDLTDKKAEEARGRLASLVQSADDAIIAKTLDGAVLDWNKGAERVYGYTAEEMVGRSITAIVPEDRRAERAEIRVQVLRGTPVVGFETVRVRKDGKIIPISLTLSPIRDPRGEVVGISTIERDISRQKQLEADLRRANTELRAALQEKDVLIKEIHHRVKNNLQVITSLLNLQASHVTDAGSSEVLRESQSRVRSIALVHEKIYQSSDLASIDFDAYLESLLSNLASMYDARARGIAIEAHGGGVRLGVDTAMHCGLIVNELVANAFKHAFPGGRRGRVRVDLRADDGSSTLSVIDDGAGFPAELDFHRSPSLGLQLVCSLTEQLGGSISMTREGGTAFTVRFDAPDPPPRR